jgi:hypothetical protein
MISSTFLSQDGSRHTDNQQSLDTHHNDISDPIRAINRAGIISFPIIQPSLSKLD